MVERTQPIECLTQTQPPIDWDAHAILSGGDGESLKFGAGCKASNASLLDKGVYGNLEFYDSTSGGTPDDAAAGKNGSVCAFSWKPPVAGDGAAVDKPGQFSLQAAENPGERNDINQFLREKLTNMDRKIVERLSELLTGAGFCPPRPEEEPKQTVRLGRPDDRPVGSLGEKFDQILKHLTPEMEAAYPGGLRRLARLLTYLGLKPPADSESGKPSGEGNQKHILPYVEPGSAGSTGQSDRLPPVGSRRSGSPPNLGVPEDTRKLVSPPNIGVPVDSRRFSPPNLGVPEDTRKSVSPPNLGVPDRTSVSPPNLGVPPAEAVRVPQPQGLTPEERQHLKDKLRRHAERPDERNPPVKEIGGVTLS